MMFCVSCLMKKTRVKRTERFKRYTVLYVAVHC
jgi:hypothetical protein